MNKYIIRNIICLILVVSSGQYVRAQQNKPSERSFVEERKMIISKRATLNKQSGRDIQSIDTTRQQPYKTKPSEEPMMQPRRQPILKNRNRP